MRKLHIGGQVRASGWEVIDANPGPYVDHVGNAGDLSRFETATFTDVYASHVLEHFDYIDALVAALKEWRRVLAVGGKLHLSVPDLDTLAEMICDRAHLSPQDRFIAMRMIFGGHVDQYDYHLVGLNEEFLTQYLLAAEFMDIRRVEAHGLFEDTSLATIGGVPISLNMTAVKGRA